MRVRVDYDSPSEMRMLQKKHINAMGSFENSKNLGLKDRRFCTDVFSVGIRDATVKRIRRRGGNEDDPNASMTRRHLAAIREAVEDMRGENTPTRETLVDDQKSFQWGKKLTR